MANQPTLNALLSAQSFKFHSVLRTGVLLFLSLLFSGCGVGEPSQTGETGSSGDDPPIAPLVRLTVGGTVTGLTGSGLILQNNGGNKLTVS